MGAKTNSLLKLMNLNLNTPDVIILRDREDIARFLKSNVWGDWRKVSIRTDNKERMEAYKKWGLPFFPNKTKEEAREILTRDLPELVDRNIDILVAEGINPEESTLSGKYFKSLTEDLLEYILGPSTVRDIERGSPKCWDVPEDVMPVELPLEEMKELLYVALKTISKEFRMPFVIEFSVYPYPMGRLKKTLIFWEVIESK